MLTMNAREKAKELGATIDEGINWTWAKGFPSMEVGLQFVTWLEQNGYDHRGYNPAQPDSLNYFLRQDGVRFR